MPFIQLDDQITEHPKLLQAGAVGAWVWVSAIAYCQRQLTDGFIPDAAVPRLAREASDRLLARLCELQLLERVVGGYRVHDYLGHNPSKETVLRRRDEATKRKAKHRERVTGTRDGTRDGHAHNGHVTDTSLARARPTPTPTDTAKNAVSDARATPGRVPPNDDVGALPTRKRRLAHAFESTIGLDVPQFLHDEFAAKLRNVGVSDAESALVVWYAATEGAYAGQDVGEDAIDFWRQRFREWRGATPKRSEHRRQSTGGGGCEHAPRCSSITEHTARVIADARAAKARETA